jgi:hypothetical protein
MASPCIPPRERLGVVHLDEQVQVIPLDRVVHDAHAVPPARFPKSILEQLRPAVGPKVADARLHTQRHVHRMSRSDNRPLEVRHAGPVQAWVRPRTWPPGALARATSLRQRKRELSSHAI